MKRVLVILPNLDLGGAETVIMNFFRCFDEIVFDFAVHGEKGFYEDEALSLGARIFRVPTRSESFFGNIFAMQEIYKAKTIYSDDAYFSTRFIAGGGQNIHVEKYDTVIVCSEHAFAFIELAVAWSCGVKTRAAWSHFSDYQGTSRLKRQANFFAQPFLRLFGNLFLACTKDAGRWLFGKSFKKSHIINNAMDLEKFKFNLEAREKIREKHEISNKYIIGITGRLSWVKNHAFALKVFRRLRMEDAVLLIVGGGELREEIEAKAALLNISHKVIFAGKVESTADYYQAIDLLLIPSFHEGLPLVTIEAQAASLPVIMSDAIPPEAKISEYACFMSLKDGAEAWAEKILEIKESASKNKRAVIDLKNSGYHITSEAKKLQEFLTTS
ncbi:MAG: glycosyltransferase [Defluviitaleaceae bacterium]|nr:glycosyltransferase [Defluviitaleaceae bacterium]